ncbi:MULTISPECIES: hypothetical protein [unclassified Cupriavidus]|uniref:hypothetical protein n=1 Tax=Cupriavidus sp. H19C3 TaxID=3241603 RepID=UPI003BF8B95F
MEQDTGLAQIGATQRTHAATALVWQSGETMQAGGLSRGGSLQRFRRFRCPAAAFCLGARDNGWFHNGLVLRIVLMFCLNWSPRGCSYSIRATNLPQHHAMSSALMDAIAMPDA